MKSNVVKSSVLYKYGFAKIWLMILLIYEWGIVTIQSAKAESFNVLPIRVYLKGRSLSQELKISNESANTQRFQVTVKAWEQNEQGEMQLSDTQDIIAFPQLFELAKGEYRLVRVGTLVPPTTKERTYRVFLQQLAKTENQEETTTPKKGVQLNFLIRVGIPIFIAPIQIIKQGKIDKVNIEKDKIFITINNTGNIHILTSSFVIKGYDDTGKVVFQGNLGGGYILAGNRRIFQEKLPQENCKNIRNIGIEIGIDKEQDKPLSFTEKVETPNGVCQ